MKIASEAQRGEVPFQEPCYVVKKRYLNTHLCDYSIRVLYFSKVGKKFNF